MEAKSGLILKTLNQYEPKSLHHEVPVVWDVAEDSYVYDINLKRYIDFTSGIFVANAGHGRIEIADAIMGMLNRPLMHAYVFPTEIRARLVKTLAELSGMDKVFLCSTGSEAVEAALRCMWAYNPDKMIISFEGEFHGNTLGAQMLRGRHLVNYAHMPVLQYAFDSLPPSEDSCIWKDDIGGVIFESYRGYDARFHEVKMVQEWARVCKKWNIPLCFDEIQSGFGRTGKWFAYEHYGVKPDLVCIGKGLSGGLPISAVLGRADLLDAPDDLSSTHTGNPICCAAALANIEVLIKDKLIERAARLGELLYTELRVGMPYKVQGKGMVYAILIGDKGKANRIVDRCAESGLLMVKTHRGTLKIAPPLSIPEDVLWEGVGILKEVTKKCE